MGRPKKNLTRKEWDSVKYMCMIHCTGEEIAGVLGMDYDTLNRNCKDTHGIPISEYIKTHSSNGKMSLRRAQWKSAEKGNTSMLIWLGKQWLGQKEAQDISITAGVPDEIKKEVEALLYDESASDNADTGTTL